MPLKTVTEEMMNLDNLSWREICARAKVFPEMLEALETLFDITPFATNDKDAEIRLRVRKVIRKAKGE